MYKRIIFICILILFSSSISNAAYMGRVVIDFENLDYGNSLNGWYDPVNGSMKGNNTVEDSSCCCSLPECERVCVDGACAFMNQDIEGPLNGDANPPRYGNKYFRMWYTYPADACSSVVKVDNGFKSTTAFYGYKAIPDHPMAMEMGVEYWIGFSTYVPADYYVDRYGTGFVDFKGYDLITGKDSLGRGPITLGFRNTGYITASGAIDEVFGPQWAPLRGTWIDFVIHTVPASAEHPSENAIWEYYVNGVKYVVRSLGQTNLFSAFGSDHDENTRAVSMLYIYNPWLAFGVQSGWAAEDLTDRCDQAYFPQPSQPWTLELSMDEVIRTEGTIGAYNYCSVTPPIVAAAPIIIYPTNGATGVDPNGSITYYNYSDSRLDLQSCFTRKSTTIQIRQQGGSWDDPIYENTSAGATSQAFQNLSPGQTYEARVMHVSVRSGYPTETYDGIWSNTITFTTSGGSITNLSPVSQIICNGSPTTFTMSFHSEVLGYFKWTTNPANTTYSSMENTVTNGQGGTDHSVSISQTCGTTVDYYIIGNTQLDGLGESTERVKLTVDIASAVENPDNPPTYSPTKIIYRRNGSHLIRDFQNGISLVRLPSVGSTGGTQSISEFVIDNGEPGTSYYGAWGVSGGADPYGTESLTITTAERWYDFDTSIAKSGQVNGTYQVSIWHTYWSSRCEAVPIQIYNGETLLGTEYVNQKQNYGDWFVLGNYAFTGDARIRINSDATGSCSTCADAIRVVKQ